MVEKYKLYTGFLFSALWLRMGYGFIYDEFMPFMQPTVPAILFIVDAIILILGIIALKDLRDKIVYFLLVALIIASKVVNHQSIVETLNGFRLYIGLVSAVPIIRYLLDSKNAARFVSSFDRQLHIFLYIQVFCLVWQFLKYGANDHGGGTLGYGGSGAISTMIYISSFYLLNKKWDFDGDWKVNLVENKKYFILLFPTFLNETKISFIYLILYFLLLIRRDRMFVLRMVVLVPTMIIAAIGVGILYINATKQDADEVFSMDYIEYYLSGGQDVEDVINLAVRIQEEDLFSDELWSIDLPRFAKLFQTEEALKSTEGGYLLGAGVGQFRGGSVMGKSRFATKFNWLLKGSIPSLFWLLIELGLLGVLWFAGNLISALMIKNPGSRGTNLRFYIFMVWLLILFYDMQLSFIPTVFVSMYALLTGLQPSREAMLAYEKERR